MTYPFRASQKVSADWPLLMASLKGAGLVRSGSDEAPFLRTPGEGDGPGIVLAAARGDGPALCLDQSGETARITFDQCDASFGFTLIAELLRGKKAQAFAEPATAALFEVAARWAQANAPIVIQGASGTGKEGLAKFVHCRSPRHLRPFAAINCAAVPEPMAEAILFGHERGSFTGATSAAPGLFRAADGGTLFLDEIADLGIGLQAKLLRALQEGEVLPVGAVRPVAIDVRFLCAANRDLQDEVAAGRFREDLYWRLNVGRLELPPLKCRRQDIRAVFAACLIRRFAGGGGLPWPTTEALDLVMGHDWPGNAREVDSVVQRALIGCSGSRIAARDLVFDRPMTTTPETLGEIARSSQASAIRQVLNRVEGHRGRAAIELGISERTLRYRLAEMRLAA